MPSNKTARVALFEGKQIRRVWDEKGEKWWFSVVDVVGVLSDSVDSRKYWNKLAQRLRDEGSESVTKCHQLKLESSDGKFYLTDCADTETMFRIIQSIPSPKAEPFKLWLARIGYERVEETQDPEKTINRALKAYRNLGRSDDWINQRLKSIEIRKELTDEWEDRGIREGLEFAILTDDISRAWAGMKTRDYKRHKNLKKENLRDHMTNLELVLTMLAEVSTTEISKQERPKFFPQHRIVARRGGGVAKVARKKLEKETGRSIVESSNYLLKEKKRLPQ